MLVAARAALLFRALVRVLAFSWSLRLWIANHNAHHTRLLVLMVLAVFGAVGFRVHQLKTGAGGTVVSGLEKSF